MNIRSALHDILSSLPPGVTLVAVSKTHPVEKIREAYDAGQRDFGENKVQELCAKAPLLPADIRWHLVGHLQTNKVKQAVTFASLIHSADSLKLINEISRQATKLDKTAEVLMQVHIAEEESKYGFSPDEARKLLLSGAAFSKPFLKVRGLMGMATLSDDPEKIRAEFRVLKNLFDEAKKSAPEEFGILSMGMSGDYRIAAEEGSSMVRIGSAIFGSR